MRTLTVREVTGYIKDLLESDYNLANLWVRGEISNFKRASSGHLYFTLKDEYTSIRVVMFRSRASKLDFELADGMDVRIRGYISVYERSGQYQLYSLEVEPGGAGALYAAFEQLKKKLSSEGLFDEKYKKNIPRFPKKIGLVTSPSGAAVRDMINILQRRWPGIEILLAPVKVQGNEAVGEICYALRQFNKLHAIDLIVVGRGGGSLEELWAFNTETVCREIFNSSIPVISAVGHETDFTISDMVADLRAPTPSAAAELAVPDSWEMLRYLESMRSRLSRNLEEKVKSLRLRLDNCRKSRVMNQPVDIICHRRNQTVDNLEKQLVNLTSQKVHDKRSRLSSAVGRLNALSPLATLERGYSICRKDGRVIRKSEEVDIGNEVDVLLHRGLLHCEVRKKE